ncbi:MAG: hypothetical protein QRY72_05810 [Candidatus Rhabdochlamydia sp.]
MTLIQPKLQIIQQLDSLTSPYRLTDPYLQAKQWHEGVQPLRSAQFSFTCIIFFIGTISALIASKKNSRLTSYLLITTISLVLLPSLIELCTLWKRVSEECKLFNILKEMQLEMRYAWQAKSNAICECTSSYNALPTHVGDSRDSVLTYIETLSSSYNTLPLEDEDLFSFLSEDNKAQRQLFVKELLPRAAHLKQMQVNQLPYSLGQVPHFLHGFNSLKEAASLLFQKPNWIIDWDKTSSFVKLEYNTSEALPRIQTQPWMLPQIPEEYLTVSLKGIVLYAFFHIERSLIHKHNVSIQTKEDSRLEKTS